jgi:xylulokinase
MAGYLLGIDIGTTSTKAVVCDLKGGILAEASAPATLRSERPGWAEADPDQWWANLSNVIPRCLETAGVAASAVAVVGVSGMVPAVVLLDRDGRVVRPSIQQNDARSHHEIEQLKAEMDGARILQRTGNPITQQSVGPKLQWLHRHEPEAMARTDKVLGSYDFVVHRLTRALSIERNWALESGLWDLHKEDWDDELLALAGVGRGLLPAVRRPADIVGYVTRGAASATGLAESTPVVAGSADHVASALSAGLRNRGDLLVKLGGAGDILYCLDSPESDPRLFLDYHVIPDRYLLNGCMTASGSIIRWFRDELAPQADYASLDAEAASVAPGSGGLILLPYFLGEKTPFSDPLARGMLFGLTLSHTRAHIYRAILEGISFGFRHHREVFEERGLRPKLARVTNGGAHSELWRQVTADVLGLPLERIARHPGSSLGAAFVGGMGIGAFDDWREIDRYIQVEGLTEPDMDAHERYSGLYRLYRDLYESLKDKFPLLATVEGGVE